MTRHWLTLWVLDSTFWSSDLRKCSKSICSGPWLSGTATLYRHSQGSSCVPWHLKDCWVVMLKRTSFSWRITASWLVLDWWSDFIWPLQYLLTCFILLRPWRTDAGAKWLLQTVYPSLPELLTNFCYCSFLTAACSADRHLQGDSHVMKSFAGSFL